MEQKSIGKKNEKNCYGCMACKQICPKNAISIIMNDRGFYIPYIEKSKCIECGLCKNVCPYIKKSQKNRVKKVYAAKTNNKEYIIKSTSGGIFSTIAANFIKQNGYVAGVIIDKNLKVKYSITNDLKKLDDILKSKYVQAEINNTYIEIKELLLKDKKVLFSGTGCQIAGLKLFLKKDFENLYTIEVVCHGVPSPGLFKKYIEWLEQKEKINLLNYIFRTKDKNTSGIHSKIKIQLSNNKIKYLYAYEDPYYSSFLDGKISRATCYNCKFKGEDRISDMTLGDFWGIEKKLKNFPSQKGVSGILINTEKGNTLFESIKNNLFIVESDFKSISDYNKSIVESSNIKDKINYNINDKDLFKNLTPKRTIIEKIKYRIPSKIKYYLKRIK